MIIIIYLSIHCSTDVPHVINRFFASVKNPKRVPRFSSCAAFIFDCSTNNWITGGAGNAYLPEIHP